MTSKQRACPYSVCRDCGLFAHKSEEHLCTGGACMTEASHARRRQLKALRDNILAVEADGRSAASPRLRRLDLRRQYNAKLQAHRCCRG